MQIDITTIHNPLRDFVEHKREFSTHYRLEFDNQNLFHCVVERTEKDGEPRTIDFPVEEFFKKFDKELGEKVRYLNRFNQDKMFSTEDAAYFLGISTPTLNKYIRNGRSSLNTEGKLSLNLVYILTADFMPYRWLNSSNLNKELNLKTTVIDEMLSNRKYDALFFKKQWRISPFGVNQIKFDYFKKEHVKKIDGEDFFSVPYIAALACKRYGAKEGIQKKGYCIRYNSLLTNPNKRLGPSKKQYLEISLTSKLDGFTHYVSKETMETLLDAIPISTASSLWGIDLEEIKANPTSTLPGLNPAYWVSRKWCEGQQPSPKLETISSLAEPDKEPDKEPDIGSIKRDLDSAMQDKWYNEQRLIGELRVLQKEMRINHPQSTAYEVLTKYLDDQVKDIRHLVACIGPFLETTHNT